MGQDEFKRDSSTPSSGLMHPIGLRSGFLNARRRAYGQVISVMIVVVAITFYVQIATRRQTTAPPTAQVLVGEPEPAVDAEAGNAPETAETSVVAEKPEAPPVTALPEPAFDRKAVAIAEDALDAASRDRARADDRAAESARRLALATTQAALDATRAKKIAFLVRDPSTRIAQASSRGGFVRGERDKLEKELTTLRNLPRPKSVSILSKSPVARPADNGESHFELRRNRISYIDLERLLDLTRADAQVRIRMSDRVAAITNKVGPVGSFSLEYELLKAVPGSVEELLERKSLRYDLRAWEIVPEFENRGETYEATKNPISEFTRAVNRINPGRGTITLWVYPDSFTL